ncbi:MAG: TATA-box-binding protein [Candidatus Altiarchaeota archaeon]|nr:TATA-box-binding protein [Candidatus Altiarchaeota archaeon]
MAKKAEMKTKVENIVSSITLDRHLDLKQLAKKVKEINNPKQFPGVIYRLEEPKLAMLIFRTGKVICSGARSRQNINDAVAKLLKTLAKAGFRIKAKPVVEIQNIVASSSLDFKVNLDVLATECMNTEYEPEQFPGLVFRLDDPKTVMLIFRSGKIIITGAKTARDVTRAAERTRDTVKSFDAII